MLVALSLASRRPLVRNSEHSTGVCVKATSSEAKMAMQYDSPSGVKILPSGPDRKNTGRKTTMVMRVA